MSPTCYRLLADLIVAFHFAYVAFVVLGLPLIMLGIPLHWSWVRNFWFRVLHLIMIGVVVLESLCGIVCPLTDWEDVLREKAGETIEAGTFIGRLAHRLLFFDIPQGSPVFPICYCLFGLAVLCVWIVAPPRWPWKRSAAAKKKDVETEEPPPRAP
jgi:hypothetical protein